VAAAPAHMKKMGPFKFSHKQLESDGVIMESDVPSERRSGISFSFTCSTPGIFDVAVVYKFKNITSMQVRSFCYFLFIFIIFIFIISFFQNVILYLLSLFFFFILLVEIG
jgi:hypothetical protein